MAGDKTWIQEQEEFHLFRGGDLRQVSLHMLGISPTNRIIGLQTAKLAIGLRMLNHRLGVRYNWLSHLVDMAEEYQLTIGDPINARDAFIEALRAQVLGQASLEKSKENMLTKL